MLHRAKRLVSSFNRFYLEYAITHLQVTPDEWRQVDYLLYITAFLPIYDCTLNDKECYNLYCFQHI